MEKEIIDQPEEEINPKSSSFELLAWWEERRLSFNIVVGGSGFLGLWVYDSYELIYYYPEIVLEIIIYALIVNAFYTLGWSLELLRIHYKFTSLPLDRIKEVLYYSGIFFGVAFTFFLSFLSSFV